MTAITGLITDIQRFSVHDGPGIRTTVFLKGCQLRCAWCHNPETIAPSPELQIIASRCIGCGGCLSACRHGARTLREGAVTYGRERCTACGACVRECFAGALELVGRTVLADAVLAEVLQDRDFYRESGGGVTLSGGEPLCQLAFSREVLRQCRHAGISTAIESNMAWPWRRVAAVLPYLDLVMMDLKFLDPARHKAYTGVSNTLILANARRLAEAHIPLIVRTPVIPGVNDAEIDAIAGWLAALPGISYYELLPYHPLGTDKLGRLGYPRGESYTPPSPARMQELTAQARQTGLTVRWAGERQ